MSHGQGRYLVWSVGPHAIVSQLRAPGALTAEMAALLPEVAWPVLTRRPPPPEGYTIVGDWSSMTSYESEARRLLTSFTLEHRKPIGRLCIVLAETSSPLVKMGVTAASAALAVAGLRLDVRFDGFERVRRDYGLPT
ncbi:MAG: hypothetical protein H6722_33945 [Sandaracinus sp.]|nr:hypothetical protein [Sandaracinus sp.]MCB9617463.1 hypothetical protein [Sandaracinus sp.]